MKEVMLHLLVGKRDGTCDIHCYVQLQTESLLDDLPLALSSLHSGDAALLENVRKLRQ